MTTKKRRFNFKGIKLEMFCAILIVVLIMSVSTMILISNGLNEVVKTDEMKNLRAQSNFITEYLDKIYPGNWSSKDGKLYKSNKLISEDTDIVDLVAGQTGYNCTFFLNDTRVSTNIYSNDKRVVGTKASTDIIDSVLKKGNDFLGSVKINGVENISFYTPIKDVNGKIIGMLFLGDPVTAINKVIDTTKGAAIFVCIIMIILSIIIAFGVAQYFTSKINKILNTIRELKNSHLNVRSHVKAKDEIGQMSKELDAFANDLQENVVGTMRSISEGNLDGIELSTDDPQNEIIPVFKQMIETVRSITDETDNLIVKAKDGDLTVRCDSEKYSGNWKVLTESLNELMESIAQPVTEVSSVLEKLSMNDYSARVSDIYKGVFHQLENDTNTLCNSLTNIQNTIIAVSSGDTSSLSQFEETQQLCENDNMTPSLILMMKNIDNLITEVANLSRETAGGNLFNARGDSDKFEGGYKEIVEGFNNTLDAISNPLEEIQQILNNMAKNDFTQKASTEYAGDYLNFANLINDVIDQLTLVQNCASQIADGDISALEKMREIGARSENDKLIPACISMMESIQSVIEEVEKIADYEAHGDFSFRGDTEKFKGKYVEIIEGVNKMVEAVEKPTNEISRVMARMSDGYFDEQITGNYEGQFALLVDSINTQSAQLHKIISELSLLVTRMGEGDFNIETVEDYNGEFKSISDALNKIIVSLNELFGSVTSMTDLVSVESNNVAAGSENLAQSTTEQASTIEEINSTMEEISSMTKDNATQATKADSLVTTVNTDITTAKQQMNDLVNSIENINSAAKNISKINKVIEDIAFQTNILAINASVEAARAGIQGKSFAVVADEVRNLAAKSGDAAKDTAKLIETTIQTVNVGSSLAKNASATFTEVSTGMSNVSEIMSEIAVNSNKQANSIEQIDTGINQVSMVVQTNSATAEESAASSKELTSQASMLKKEVGKFKLRASALSKD